MASPHQLPPQVGDTMNLLLKKLVTATQGLGGAGGIFLTEAEANALYFRLDGSNSPFTKTSATVVTVPDAFSLTSAGSIALAAGGSNKNITATPSGTGGLVVVNTTNAPSVPTPLNSGTLLQVVGAPIEVNAFAGASVIQGRRANTSAAAPSAVASGNTLLSVGASGYGTNAWAAANRAAISFKAAEAWTNTAQGTRYEFGTTLIGGTTQTTVMQLQDNGQLVLSPVSSSVAAWGTGGVLFSQAGSRIFTDSTSSGTVATAVVSSFGAQTFAASSATTFTNAANLYIAGDVAAGTNVTLTNSYGLWNVGKTRLDGNALITGTSSLKFGATAAATITVSADTTAGQLVITPPATGYVNVAGPLSAATTGSGNLDVGYDARATDIFMRVNGAAGNRRGMLMFTAGVARWRVVANSTAESGANAGSNFAIESLDDAGAALATPLIITRSSSLATFAGNVTVSGGALVLSGTSTITGGAGNMTITAGTGASRTLTLQATSAGSTATAFLTGTDTGMSMPSTATTGLQFYNTADQTTNYERLETLFTGNIATIRSVKAGTGTQRSLQLSGGGGTLLLAGGNAAGSMSFGFSTSGGNTGFFGLAGTSTTTTGPFFGVSITPTYNQASGTSANTDLLINRTETAVGSGAQLLIDAQVASVSKFSVGNTGNITMGGTAILTKPGGTIPLITTNTAITDGAGAQAGTLLNSPVAGNPTKWVRINDNGTTRYIPAW